MRDVPLFYARCGVLRGIVRDSLGRLMTDQDTSTSQNIKYPHWQREFEAALLEGDPQTLRQRVDAAEAAIFLRSQALVVERTGTRGAASHF